MVDEGNLYRSFYGIGYQFYVLQICNISRREQAPALQFYRRRMVLINFAMSQRDVEDAVPYGFCAAVWF